MKKKTRTRIGSILLTMAMILSLLPVTAGAEGDEVPYLDENGNKTSTAPDVTVTEINDENASDEWSAEENSEAWYVVSGSVTIEDRITVTGEVHLILADGCTLNAEKGISVTAGNSLTIYAQSAYSTEAGTLDATVYQAARNAGIGGDDGDAAHGDITINGGNIKAKGGDDAAGIGGGSGSGQGTVNGQITINGGKIEADGGPNNGAGIGGGYFNRIAGGDILISGGDVTATGGKWAAGIGGGYSGAGMNITITGGTVEATGGVDAAGIGAGNGSSTPLASITITGGNVTANGGTSAAGIGGGSANNAKVGTIEISGNAKVTATGGGNGTYGGAGIGAGGSGACGIITIGGSADVTAAGGTGETRGGAGIGAGGSNEIKEINGNYESVPNYDRIVITGGTVEATGGSGAEGIGGNESSTVESVSISGGTFSKGTFSDDGIPEEYFADGFKSQQNTDGTWGVTQSGNRVFSSGIGTEGDPYLIDSVEVLKAFRDSVNAGTDYQGQYIELAEGTYDLSGETNWEPIGNGSRDDSFYTGNAFKGNFDGNGQTIKGLKITSGSGNTAIGLFGVVAGGTVKDLKLDGVSINVSDNKLAGGVAGLLYDDGTVSGCTVSGNISIKDGAGGIVGRMVVSGTISDCTNNAAVTCTEGGAGGIVGKAYYTQLDKTMTIEDCQNTGNITNPDYHAGGISALSAANVTGCTNSGVITAGNTAGGIVAEQVNWGTVSDCTNTAVIKGDNNAGGIIGWVRYQTSKADYAKSARISVLNNTNSGVITTKTEDKSDGGLGWGGIVGTIYNTGYVSGNTNNAPSITGGTFGAGVVGNLQKETTNNLYHKNGKINVVNNVSTTPLDLITVDGQCRDEYAYNNNTTYFTEKDNSTAWVAQIGDQKYATLAFAVKDVEDEAIITMRESAELTETLRIPEAKKITLELNGKTISGSTDQTSDFALITNNGELTIQDSAGNGKITFFYTGATSNWDYCSNTISNRGTLTLESGTVENTTPALGSHIFFAIDNNSNSRDATLNIEGGTVSCANYRAIRQFARSTTYKNDVEITGGAVQGQIWLQSPNTEKNLGSLTISGGTITGNAGNDDGRAIYVSDAGSNSDVSGLEIRITGGTIEGAVLSGVTDSAAKVFAISGGTFSIKPDSAYLAEGYSAYSVNGKYVVTKTIISLTLNPTSASLYTNRNPETVQLTATLTEGASSDAITWSSSNENVATVSETGLVTAVGNGTATITAQVTDNIKATCTVTVSTYSAPTGSTGGGSSEPSGDYIVSVDRVSGGRVTVNPGRADRGDEVTVTVKPSDGYELDELVVTDSRGNELKLSYEGSGKYTFTMPSGTVDVKATFVKADTGSVLDDFTDVNPDAWYAQAVEFVVEEGLMTGTSATTFAPDTSMSRAMIWTVLAAYNSYNTSGGNPWYAPGQQWAMVNGVSDGTAPNSSITREQLAVMLWRAAGSPETSESLSSYGDASSVSDWAVEALAWAVDNGIISGMGGSTLAPQATATRAQVAVMLMRFVDYMEA